MIFDDAKKLVDEILTAMRGCKPMKRTILCLSFLAIASCSGSAPKFSNDVGTTPAPAATLEPGIKPKYEVEVINQSGVQLVNVTFSGKVPAPELADKILREELEKVVKKQPRSDALAYAYLGDVELTENQYSGHLVYKAAQKKILTEDEYNGTKRSGTQNDSYYVLTEEDHTMPGITPKRTWLSLSLVFPQPPPQNEAYEAIIAEVEKVRDRKLDVNVYVMAGDRNKKTSWHQVKDSDGAFIFGDYEVATQKITRRGRVLKQF